MKETNDRNQIWFEREGSNVTVGFTKDFLESLDQCWHIVPAHLNRFREKAPLMVVETNDSLISILSPITANFVHWNDKAQNFPYKLTENDVVLEMRVGAAQRPQPQVQGANEGEFVINMGGARTVGRNAVFQQDIPTAAPQAADNVPLRPDGNIDWHAVRVQQELAALRARQQRDGEGQQVGATIRGNVNEAAPAPVQPVRPRGRF